MVKTFDAATIGDLYENTFGDSDEPIGATDEELAKLAYMVADELRKRYPRYGLEQGDLDDTDEVEARELLMDAARDFYARQ